MRYWKKLSPKAITRRVFEALDANVDCAKENILGVPASYLDDKVFYQGHPWLRDAPFLTTLIHNPNHIGCHTLGESEHYFLVPDNHHAPQWFKIVVMDHVTIDKLHPFVEGLKEAIQGRVLEENRHDHQGETH